MPVVCPLCRRSEIDETRQRKTEVAVHVRMKKSRRGRRRYSQLWWLRGKERDGANVAVAARRLSLPLQTACVPVQIYTVSQKKLGHFFTAYNFRNIEQIFTKFGINQSLLILNIVPEFI